MPQPPPAGPEPHRSRDPRLLLAVFAGGAIGTLIRATLADWMPNDPATWPWPTFLVNVVGAFMLGWFVSRATQGPPGRAHRRALLETGLCGGLTTFATMQVELLRMIDAGRFDLASGYVSGSVAAGLTAVWLATYLLRRERTRT